MTEKKKSKKTGQSESKRPAGTTKASSQRSRTAKKPKRKKRLYVPKDAPRPERKPAFIPKTDNPSYRGAATRPPRPKDAPRNVFGKGRFRITDEQWVKLVDHFRHNPGDAKGWKAASEASGLSRPTCRKAWLFGLSANRPAIRLIVEEEQFAARQERIEAVQRATRVTKMAHGVEDAIRTRRQEGLMVQAARTVTGKLLGQVVKLVQAAEKLTDGMVKQLVEEYAGEDASGTAKKSLEQKLKLIERVVQLAGKGQSMADMALTLERKFMGEPEKVIGVQGMGIDEAVTELLEGRKALARLREGKVIDVTPPEGEDPISGLLPEILGSIPDAAAVLKEAGVPLRPPVPDADES